MDQSKVEQVKEWPRPRNTREVQRFLGFTGYYRYFIKDYSHLARPLLDLTKQATFWVWGPSQQLAFETLWDKMTSQPVLRQPDFNKMFFLQTNALKYGVGAVLSQAGEGESTTPRRRHPVAYYSATFSPTEQNYDMYELEFLGLLKAVEHWCPYLIWTKEPFIVEMDHKNLTYWKMPKRLMGRMAQWHERLQDYNFKILHISGSMNMSADALSRLTEEERVHEEKLLPLIPLEAFINLMDGEDPNHLVQQILEAQQVHKQWMSQQGYLQEG
jgi:hypothetical protein